MQTESLTIEIPVPAGMEIDTLDKASRKVTLKPAKPKKVTDRIKSVDDLLADHGYTKDRFNKLYEDLSDDERAYRLLKLLVVSLNEGWTPDWNNSNQKKYYPWFEMGGSSGFRYDGYGYWLTLSVVGSRLAFKSSDLAEHAGKNFTEVYKQFMLIE